MDCPPVRGDNPRALVNGLSNVHVENHAITILYHLHQCRPCTSQDILCFRCKGGITLEITLHLINALVYVSK